LPICGWSLFPTHLRRELNDEVRRNVIDAFWQFKSKKQTLAPVLVAFLRDQDLNVWLGAAFGLEDMLSPEEKQAQFVPALKQALTSPNETIRANAALFLERLNPPGQSSWQ
jgi:HEAT repeat protein